MRPQRFLQRWRYSLGFLLAAGLLTTLASWRHLVADDPAADPSDKTAAAGTALEDRVEMTVPRLLRVAGRHTYSIKVTMRNTSGEALQGPVYLIVEGTGVKDLEVDNADGTTDEDEPFFRLLRRNRGLAPENGEVSRKLEFQSDGPLRSRAKRQFRLDYRLRRDLTAEAKQRKRPIAGPVFRPGRSGRQPRAASGGSGSRSGRRQSRDSQDDDDPPAEEPEDGSEEQAAQPAERAPYTLKPGITDEDVKRAMKIQDEHTKELLEKEGVVGTATGVSAEGDLVIRVYTQRHGIRKQLPEKIDGVTVEPMVTGTIRPLFQPPQDKRGRAGAPPPAPTVTDPQQRFPRPVPIGVSGINRTLPFCATGTIGCRLKAADGTLYALSNNHVFADENNAPIGDPILQPGPLDAGCAVSPRNSIGTLTTFVPIDFPPFFANNRVDAAIAKVTSATLGNSTPPGAYGMPNEHIVSPVLGMKVQKMGRTTSYTTGRVTALNVSSFVGYATGPAFFVDQIELINPLLRINPITGTGVITTQDFSAGGDSGSLIVTNRPRNNPVGLLFAGAGPITLANPIDVVLDQLSQKLGQELKIDGAPSNAGP